VFLEVRVSNIAARKLYEKIGFVQVGQRKAYYQHPAEDALILKISF
jgi:ribosomal-protein-alanine N-acetyltransferase